jgi:hypothetical protein
MMLKFKEFLYESAFLTESIRQGLPHILTMHHDDMHELLKPGRIDLSNTTEKTDGSTLMFGHDKDGFYSQSSGSGNEKMRLPGDYAARATRRSQETGKPLDLTGSNMFDHAHSTLMKNKKLLSYLKSQSDKLGGEAKVRGELFYMPYARPSEENKKEVKFVGTSYDPSHMGSVGKVVVHSKLPENKFHDLEAIKKMGTNELNFDDDKINVPPNAVDVSDEREMMKGIDRNLLNTRTVPKNKEAKMAEQAKLDEIRKRVSDKVDNQVRSLNVSPKWGSGSEGLVVHPPEGSVVPRFKVTSDTFRKFKADKEAQANFKKRTLGQ